MKKYFLCLSIAIWFSIACSTSEQDVRFITDDDHIDIYVKDKYFTSYLFNDSLSKPVLYPVISPVGDTVTRAFPLKIRAGESTDHPHHIGIWFACNEVNHYDFWASNEVVSTIIHHEIIEKNEGKLTVKSIWTGHDGLELLSEKRQMIIHAEPQKYMIDFIFELTALVPEIKINDTKEGFFAIRVADWLREKEGTGTYISSEGGQSEDETWGRRAKWMWLKGNIEGETVNIAIFDHPDSFNHPSYWMNRGYGLFSVNPIGQKVYQEFHGEQNPTSANLTLKKGETATFKYRLMIYSGELTADKLSLIYQNYVKD
jgi:hypothetical protein